jgi:hypothetical protein
MRCHLHNEHNSVNHSSPSVDWSVTYVAVQPRLGLLSQRRTRFDSFDSHNSGVGRWNLTSRRMESDLKATKSLLGRDSFV